jgi:membrane protein YqaA with SNARE-associated domain
VTGRKLLPGSTAARAEGCTCDPALNRFGRGIAGRARAARRFPQRRFVVSTRCPLHLDDMVAYTAAPAARVVRASALRRLYDRVLALSASPRAPLWLFAIAFAEASFFPIPPDLLLIPMVLARPARAWRYALICTLGSVAGGALGYLIGYAVFNSLALPLLRFYHYEGAFQAFQARFAEYGLWVILIKGLTPIPYKIVTIAAGAAAFSLPLFMAASLLTRGARFFLVAGLLRWLGPPVQEFVERRLTLVTSLVAIALVGGFVILRYL